ncbi:MAG: aminotransferase [Tepidiforma sp.]|nr:MAG: aminotransferase [Tepidiforma sp.]
MTGRVVHGGVSPEELAASAARGVRLVDLSANLNPYGPHPALLAAARGAVLERYPAPDVRSLREAWARALGLEPGQVLAGNGSSELIYLVCRAFGAAGRCLVFGPTFGEYRAAAEAAGMEVVEAPHPGGRAGAAQPGRLVREVEPRLVFLCNPNNPTGQLCTRAEVEALREAAVEAGGRLVADEAYMPFAWPEDEAVLPRAGLLVLRSLTKLHAVPGLRLGLLLGDAGDVAAVADQQPPWAVSAPAAAAGVAALELEEFCWESVRRIAATRAALTDGLERAGFEVRPSLANFVLVRVGDAGRFRSKLLVRGFVVRDCTSFGLPEWVRVAVPAEGELGRLIRAMEEVQRWLAAEC